MLSKHIRDSSAYRWISDISLLGWSGQFAWTAITGLATFAGLGVGQAMIVTLLAFVAGLWALDYLKGRVPALTRSSPAVVSVRPFHPGSGVASLYVKNVSGRQDEISAQVVGWLKGRHRPEEAHVAWTLEWHASGGPSLVLNHEAKGRLDFARIRYTERGHIVDPDKDAALAEYSDGFELLINGLRQMLVDESPRDFFQGTWHRGTATLKPSIWTFLVRFTAGRSGLSQEECVTVWVVGGPDDDPINTCRYSENRFGTRHYSRPEIRLTLARPSNLPPAT